MSARAGGRRALGWLAFLIGTIVVLRAAASGTLAAPPLRSLDALAAWADARSPVPTAVAMVRFAAEIAAWYLLGLTALYGAAALLRSGGVTALADALAVPGARRLVRGGLGLGLLASTAAGASNTDDHADARAPSTAMMQPVAVGAGDPGTARMAPQSPVAERSEGEHATPAPEPGAGEAPPTTWVVDHGESLWTIATDVLAGALGRAPSDAEVDPYWRSLVDANRGRLVDDGDPDLILPGQVFELPPL